MRNISYNYALLITPYSPVYKAAVRLNRPNKSAAVIIKKLYGIPYNTLTDLLNRQVAGSSELIETMCETFNAYREENIIELEFTKALVPADLEENEPAELSNKELGADPKGYSANWFIFSKKLGYSNRDWIDVQDHIEEAFYKHNLRGHEFSCTKTKQEQIMKDLKGINFIYFIAAPANGANSKENSNPFLVRATLRVRNPVRPYKKKNIYYVPCRMKFDTPTNDDKTRASLEYTGNATFHERFVYITLLDESSATMDYIHIILDMNRPWNNMYGGIYTTVSVDKSMYSSGAVLENKQSVLTAKEMYTRKATFDFMYRYSRIYPNNLTNPLDAIEKNDSAHNGKYSLEDRFTDLDSNKKEIIKRVLKDSPFSPDLKLLNNNSSD